MRAGILRGLALALLMAATAPAAALGHTASITCKPQCDKVAPGAHITFQAHTDAVHATYAWDLDDDGQYDDAQGVDTSKNFPTAPGTYRVGVQIVDTDKGDKAEAEIFVKV